MLDRIKRELDEKEGCQLSGFFQINRVPGSFHISSHAYQDIAMALTMQGYRLDYGYTMNHLSFGR